MRVLITVLSLVSSESEALCLVGQVLACASGIGVGYSK